MRDPQALIQLIDDLSHDMHRWDGAVREEADRLRNAQVQLEEQVDLMRRLAIACADEAAAIANSAETLQTRAGRHEEAVQDTARFVAGAQASAMAAAATAAAQRHRWIASEGEARIQLADAEAEEQHCRTRLAEATAQLANAEDWLRRAQSALSSCQSTRRQDSKGNWHSIDCSQHVNTVSAASHEVSAWAAAQNQRAIALSHAQEEVAAAQRRLDVCIDCVQQAGNAVRIAGLAVANGERAGVEASRARMLMLRALEHTAMAVDTARAQQAAVDRLDRARIDARKTADEAAEHMATVQRAQEGTGRDVASARGDLASLSDVLHVFDTPRKD